MFFITALIQRKLTSILRPWLTHDPQFDLKLGFFNSSIVAKNLNFNIRVLTDLIENGAELSCLIDKVTIDEVVVRVSYWSFPAFHVDFSGVNVTFLLEKRRFVRVEKSVDEYVREQKRKILAEIDSDGSMLHDKIENMMMIASMKSQLKDSLTNLLMMHCCLGLNEIRVRVDYPASDDRYSWLCYSKELKARCSNTDLGSLLGGAVCLVFQPLREASFVLETSKLEIGAAKKNYNSCILCCVSPYFSFSVKDFILVNSALYVQEMNFSFSPTQIQIVGAFNNLLNIECNHIRSGRLLWEIVRLKIHHCLFPPGCILYKLVRIAVFWLRLVKEYHYFLVLVGYSENEVKMPIDRNFSRLAEQHWKMISQTIEKELPAEAIASARRVARHRAALPDLVPEDIVASPRSSNFYRFWRIFMPLVFIWWATVKILEIIWTLFGLHKHCHKVGLARIPSEIAGQRCCFLIGLGKISAVISCMDGSCPVRINSNLRRRTSHNDMFSFLLLGKGFLFTYEDGISEQYLSITLGFLEVASVPIYDDSDKDPISMSKYVDAFIGTLKSKPDGSETILSGEPALMCHPFEGGETGLRVPMLEQLSAEMELVWKRMLLKFQGSNGIYDGTPWAVCVIHRYQAYSGFKSSDYGFLKCSLMVGKLHILLRYPSIVSIATLIEQVEHAFCQHDDSQIAVVSLNAVRTSEEPQDTNVLARSHPNTSHKLAKDQDSGELKSIMKMMKMSTLKLLPDKHVEVRAVIAGPSVQISLRNEKLRDNNMEPNAAYGQKGVDLVTDVHNIEFAIWPGAKTGAAAFEEYERADGFESELFNLEEPVAEEFSESVNIAYASKGQVSHFCYLKIGGLDVYFEDMVEDNPLMQVLVLKPMTAKFTTLRNFLYSFARSAIVSSLSLQAVLLGITGYFYMDELSLILQVVESLFSAASTPACGYSGLHAVQNTMLGLSNEEMLIGVNKEVGLSFESALSFVSASFEFGPSDIIFHKSRNGIDRRYFSMLFDAYNIQNLGLAELPKNGIWLSIQKACVGVSFEEAKAEANANFHKSLATMFGYKNQTGTDESEVANAVIHSVDRIHEVSLSTCTINFLIDCLKNSGAVIIGRPNSHIEDKSSESNVSAPVPRHVLLMSITFDEIFIGTCSIKNGLSWTHPEGKLDLSLEVGSEFESVTTKIQGGCIFIEVKILARFAQCCISYLEFMKSLLTMDYPHRKSRTVKDGVNVLGKEHLERFAQANTSKPSFKEDLLKAYSINVSQLSPVLLITDESRVVKEFIGRVNLKLKLWLENNKRKFLFNIHYLDFLSRTLGEDTRHSGKDIQIAHFSSEGLVDDSLRLDIEDSARPALQREKTTFFSNDASLSSSLDSMKSSNANCSASSVFQPSEKFENCILERLATSISAEKSISRDDNDLYSSTRGWAGNGSVSGLNLTISLSDIQMLLSSIESVSGSSSNAAAIDVEEKSSQFIDQQYEKDLEEALPPDGAIVAIQDVHEHMFITVESVENKYKLGGTIHYSLAGRKSLFRVKHHKRGLWNFSSSWFSLLSLQAKSDSGVPLRLNYTRSSGFVEISSTDDSSCALWKFVSSKHEIFEDDVDLDPLNRLSKSTFYLVNKKNDCGAAFNRGALEFVKKPGNPFKFKIFNGLIANPDVRLADMQTPEPLDLAAIDGQDNLAKAVTMPCISLTIEKISLTLVDELTDPKHKLPLLQGSVDCTDFIVQILPRKTRVMSTLNFMLYYFDVHRFIWREFVLPINTSIYWRSSSSVSVMENLNNEIQSHLYFKIEEFDLSLTELLLDMLLYMVGTLDLAGPFAVKYYAVVANRCKVENDLDLDLLCYFRDNLSVRVGRRQSACVLRHLNEAPEESHVTVLLENSGVSSTSSVHVPLSRTQIFAWRTRIISQEGSRTFPGPVIVFDISKNAEEGLSLHVSPLLRLHNNTGFPVELRIQRPESMEAEFASVLLREGDTVDDCMAAFDAISLSGGTKKALLSFGVGNFVLSFRPKVKEEDDLTKYCSVEWSDNLKGGKAVRLSGVIDKLGYQVRKALTVDSWKHYFSTSSCSVRYGDAHVAQMHFLVQSIAREVPIMQPNDCRKGKNSSIALQEQKEIFLLPTVRVSNLLESDIDVLLSETEISTSDGIKNINKATIQCGSTVDLYANPAIIFFNITLNMFSSTCKPVNCTQCLKKLNKKKDGAQFLDIDLEFCGGMYFACLRLVRGNRGMLEACVFTQYTLRNDSDFRLLCAAPHSKQLSRDDAESLTITTPPHCGTLLPPKSTRSWFMKSSKVCMILLDEKLPKSTLDLDALSGPAEVKFCEGQGSGNKYLVKLGISLRPLKSKTDVPAQMVSIAPRFLIFNDSDEQISVRQCFVEGDFEETVEISSKHKAALFFRVRTSDNQDITVFNKLLRKHKPSEDDSFFVQFNPNKTLWGWSGPVCVASLGCFFLKFKRYDVSPVHELDSGRTDNSSWEYATVRVVEEGSTFALHFHRPPDTALPYRIENNLLNASITYYQKDTFQPETLESGGSISYVWDDLSRPHKLIVKINGFHMQREINLDKLRPWKSFFRVRKQRELASHLSLEIRASDGRGKDLAQMNGIDMGNVGYEVYVDGPTRVLRISHASGRSNTNSKYRSCKKVQLRISYFAIRLLEPCKQDHTEDVDLYDLSTYTPIIIGRLENISFDSIIIGQRKYNQIWIQSMNVDEKWLGAPFAAMLRRHLTSNNPIDDYVLFIVFVLFPTTSTIRDVRYSSIILQPIDMNLDEETLMKIVPFWRTSLNSNTQSQQYYFDHFEIHPIKITASFLPEDSYSSYSSGQAALRSLLHSVIKIPAIKNMEVELNGVLVTHALVTIRELLLRCARHYSWYGMRAIYIAKGSPLLPPTFASVFDDLASSSLDVFFDPSSSLFNVQGLTLGTFKLISKCIQDKGFSGTKRYFGDLSKTLKNAGSNIVFAAVTEVSDSVLKGAESNGFNGMVTGFHHGILRLAMEPSLLGTAVLEGGPDRRIKLDRSPGIDELYVEGYLQAMLDTIYKQEYLRVRVIDDQVILKNLPPNSSLIDEIMERVKDFLVSKALLKGDLSTASRPLRHLRGENEWRIGPTVLTLCQHLFVSFAIRSLRKQADDAVAKWMRKNEGSKTSSSDGEISKGSKGRFIWRWGFSKFILSAMVAYVDGRLCRCIPNPVARRIVSGFLLSFLDNKDSK